MSILPTLPPDSFYSWSHRWEVLRVGTPTPLTPRPARTTSDGFQAPPPVRRPAMRAGSAEAGPLRHGNLPGIWATSSTGAWLLMFETPEPTSGPDGSTSTTVNGHVAFTWSPSGNSAALGIPLIQQSQLLSQGEAAAAYPVECFSTLGWPGSARARARRERPRTGRTDGAGYSASEHRLRRAVRHGRSGAPPSSPRPARPESWDVAGITEGSEVNGPARVGPRR